MQTPANREGEIPPTHAGANREHAPGTPPAAHAAGDMLISDQALHIAIVNITKVLEFHHMFSNLLWSDSIFSASS